MTNNAGFSRDLKAADLEVGQELLLARTDNWGRLIQIREMVVTRKTKTRVVIAEARDPNLPQYRLTVDSYDDAVTGRYEGQGPWNGNLELYTVDDPEVPELKRAREIAKWKAQASLAAQNFTRTKDVPSARAAVEALNAYIEIAEEER